MNTEPIISGRDVALREVMHSDADVFLRWMSTGIWRAFDAPWEDQGPMSDDATAAWRERFFERLAAERPSPPSKVVIMLPDQTPIGWMIRYGREWPESCNIGVDICEDDLLGRGFGTEALRLWIEFLFRSTQLHRIGLDTWSFNPRMIHIAERMGFTFEGAERQVRFWQDEWIDRVHFGLLREERRSPRSSDY